MSVTDYVIGILLILVIFRAVRPHQLTPRAALLPLVCWPSARCWLGWPSRRSAGSAPSATRGASQPLPAAEASWAAR